MAISILIVMLIILMTLFAILVLSLGDYVGPLKWISPSYRTGGYYTEYGTGGRRKHGGESEWMDHPS